MQVWHRLAHHIINEDHRPVGLKARFNGLLEALRFDKELVHSVVR